MLKLLHLLSSNQFLFGVFHPLFRKSFADQGLEPGALHLPPLIHVPHLSGALDQGETAHRALNVQGFAPRTPGVAGAGLAGCAPIRWGAGKIRGDQIA
ncbi:hypothetical protein D3C81_1487900 [compost metagenome]